MFTALPVYEDWVSSLDWQVYFAEEPEPEMEAGSCPASSRKCPGASYLLQISSVSIWGKDYPDPPVAAQDGLEQWTDPRAF